MKKTIFLFVIFLSLVSLVNAQRYSINKLKYDSHLYVPEYDEPYNPAISGVCSFFIPGLGQMVCGEAGRGLAFLGGYTCCSIIAGVGMAQIYSNTFDYYYTGNTGNIGNSSAGVGTLLVGLGGMVVVGIWSIVDAVKVAKVNDMYIRDLRSKSSIKLEVSPFMDQLSINNQNTTSVGMTMRVKF